MGRKKKFKNLILVLVVLLFCLKLFCVDIIRVSGDSMKETITNGEVVIVNKMSPKLKQNDIVIIKIGDGLLKKNYVKRIVAVPFDTVQIIDGKLHINNILWDGDPMKDIYIQYAGIAENKITLDAEEFFLVGDNRNDSLDSRYETFGIVNRNQIVGKVIGR